MNESVYQRLKDRLLGRPSVPGELLQIGPLAKDLGVSNTPVREALTRLAAERLVVFAPQRGFFAKLPTEAEIRNLYQINQTLLGMAVSRWARPEAQPAKRRASSSVQNSAKGSAKGSAKSSAGSRGPSRVAIELARRNAELFAQIAARSGNDEVVKIVRNLNDRLYCARLAEIRVVPGAHQELLNLIALYKAGNRHQLKPALKAYYETRVRLVSPICKEMLARSYLQLT